jgi:hypothetical protein
MASYVGNAVFASPEKQHHLYQALNWLEPKRTTTEVRHRFEQLKQQSPEIAQCVWSAKSLEKKYAIDHSLPFARWPNNDLWNLLPTDSKINSQKSDRLPTQQKLKAAKERIQHWWQEAWLDQSSLPDQASSTSQKVKKEPSVPLIISHSQRFFAEANIALPGLSSDNASVDDLFEALVMQRGRLKDMQQLREW